MTGALTVASARAIEERLFRKQFCREWILAIGPPGDSSAAMLIAVDREQRIVGADRSARLVLTRFEHDRLEQGVGLWALFEQNDELFRHMDRGDILTEVRPRRSAEFWPVIVTPPEPALARWSRSESEELRLRPRLDTLALNRQPKPSRARGGLSPATLRRIRDYVDSHLDHHVDIQSLAATAELSPYHFARTFKQTEGTTPHMFVLERRLAKARELLTRPDLSLAEVALAVGFADQSHFSRSFRRAVGISPGQFRKLQD